jgi:hypothetical protein
MGVRVMKYTSISQYSSLSDLTLFGVRQPLRTWSSKLLPGGAELWWALGKGVLLVLPLMVAISLFLGSAGDSLDESLAAGEIKQQQLMDSNIALLAQRAGMYAPERVSRMAADKLSLYAAAPGQVERIN